MLHRASKQGSVPAAQGVTALPAATSNASSPLGRCAAPVQCVHTCLCLSQPCCVASVSLCARGRCNTRAAVHSPAHAVLVVRLSAQRQAVSDEVSPAAAGCLARSPWLRLHTVYALEILSLSSRDYEERERESERAAPRHHLSRSSRLHGGRRLPTLRPVGGAAAQGGGSAPSPSPSPSPARQPRGYPAPLHDSYTGSATIHRTSSVVRKNHREITQHQQN